MKIEETKKIINYLLDNNLELVKKGQHKISIGIEGAPGIGKTAVVKELAEERGAEFIRIELASMEEVGDLAGMPVKQYTLIKDGEEIQVAEKLLNEYLSLGYKICPNCEPKMTYAIPSWVPTDPNKEVILLLDDYTRATSIFMQAIMSLIQFGEYLSFKLPEKTHLVLTSNEDVAGMAITSLDSAQKSRLINFHMDFDHKQYGVWMDKNNLRSETVNFMLLNPEIFTASEIINARTYTMFANAISGFKKFDDVDTLDKIDLIAKGCFGNDTTVGSLFVTFVNNNLDKLLSAEDIISGEWKNIKDKIKENVYKDNNYRADIAAVLSMRLINYIENQFKNSKVVDKSIKRIEEIVECNETLLTEDLIFNIIRKLVNKFPSKCNKLLLNPKIRAKIL